MQDHQKGRLLSTPLFILLGLALVVFLILSIKTIIPQAHCPIKEITGILCPGCGGTSAIYHLLDGEFKAAFLSHSLFISGLILLFALCLYSIVMKLITGETMLLKFTLNRGLIVIGAIVTFTIIRNLV